MMNLDELKSIDEQKEKELRQFVFIGYILQAVFFVFVVTPIFGMITKYLKRRTPQNQLKRSTS